MEEQTIVLQEGATGENEEQELVRALIRKGILELKPVMSKQGIRYVQAEEAWNLDSKKARDLLRVLEEKGLLKPESAGRVLTCPECGSPEVLSKYTCPKCKSPDVEFTELIEHPKCGDIGSRTSFTRGISLICPRCQTTLTKETIDYRVIGNFFQCEKCHHRFDKPDVIHVCPNCQTASSYQDAKYIRVPSYRVTDEALKGLQKELPLLKNVKKVLTEGGFKVQLHAKIAGTSGVQCPFDIIAERKTIRLVMDISATGDKSDIVALLAKKVDVNPTEAIIIDLSSLDELTNLGKVFGILVLKASLNQESPLGFESFLSSLDSRDKSRKSTKSGSN